MTAIHGFELQRVQEIKELRILARLYRHVRTGCELLSLSTDDENKVFGVTFRTPPKDSTGVAHILEHSVLCGSRKYPVKEPFVELLKGSLKTFLNAFTYPDKTCYPVASQNIQDFYNLIDVYLDAVFYPRLTPQIFQQEGWHFELDDPSGPMNYKGVVYNEMKGAYSSPDNVLSEYSLQSVFPDNTYGLDSGGNPKNIPDLTFDQFTKFHKTYYHPTNGRFYFYGDDDPDNRLKIIDDFIRDFEAARIDSSIRLQAPFRDPRRMHHPFMVGKGEEPLKGMITVNWLLTETTDITTNFALIILEYILLGMPASPLRKALIDSGLGEDITGAGLETDIRQIFFSTGLKGIKVEDADRVEALILNTLKDLAQNGIDIKTIEAALNTIEFRFRENNSGSYPRGLLLMLRALTTWLYDGDPLALFAFEKPIEMIKAGVQSDPGIFGDMIRRLFLSNPHRTTLVFTPDPELKEKNDGDERQRLAAVRSAFSPAELDTVLEQTKELKCLQETPDSPEALATIPVLRVSDLEKKNKTIPIAHLDRQGALVMFHDLFTNGIVYLETGFDLHMLPEKYLPYVPLFGRALVEMGTFSEDFVSLQQRISRKTGGIVPQTLISTVKGSKRSTAWLFLRGKAMLNQAEEMTNIMRDVLLDVKLDNQERFRQMVLEAKARTEQKLVPNGHDIVNSRIKANFAESHWAHEQMSGISYLFFLRDLAKAVDEDWPKVLEVLTDIRKILVNRNAATVNITMEERDLPGFESHVDNLLTAMPAAAVNKRAWIMGGHGRFEGLTIPSLVNYVGKGADLYSLGYQFHASSLVVTRYLRNAFLWDRVRVQGGAYGAFCMFDRLSGVLSFVSYRDPNLSKTLEAFDQTAAFLLNTELSDEELNKSIIGAIGDMDSPMLPDAKGHASMVRYLVGDTEEARQQVRDQVLGACKADFKAFGRELEKIRERGLVKVLGSPEAVGQVLAERPGWLEVVKVL
ncbi:Peptidase M16 inactive domain protein [uncultured Desulfobacterium sp.]|uniref:Peptidase M16 inactive domain protein n=1 Tax=uncultured Desulfobacterium sp. TaxID=201089 RepID=A0A445MQY1_9BACT|nr:Peptidase M16 inactive domain protein [uncultured Desulfobacterium sp.]